MRFRSVTVTLALMIMMVVMMSLTAQAQVQVIQPQNYATNGLTVTSIITTTSSAASTNLDTSKGMIYGLNVSSGVGTSVVYANVFNATSANVTPGTTAPLFSVVIDGAHSQNSMTVIPWGSVIGTPYSTALSVNCTTTRGTSSGGGATAASSGCVVNALTKH